MPFYWFQTSTEKAKSNQVDMYVLVLYKIYLQEQLLQVQVVLYALVLVNFFLACQLDFTSSSY
jgi:hypothetical protein